MAATYLFKSGLLLHLSGIILMAGFALAGYIVYRRLLNSFGLEYGDAKTLAEAALDFLRMHMIGGILILVGGITMGIALGGTVMHMGWFQLKMGLIAGIILNFILTGRPSMTMLKRIRGDQDGLFNLKGEAVTALRKKVMLFYYIQLTFFLCIIALSVLSS